jgi:hypothetical protein
MIGLMSKAGLTFGAFGAWGFALSMIFIARIHEAGLSDHFRGGQPVPRALMLGMLLGFVALIPFLLRTNSGSASNTEKVAAVSFALGIAAAVLFGAPNV